MEAIRQKPNECFNKLYAQLSETKKTLLLIIPTKQQDGTKRQINLRTKRKMNCLMDKNRGFKVE